MKFKTTHFRRFRKRDKMYPLHVVRWEFPELLPYLKRTGGFTNVAVIDDKGRVASANATCRNNEVFNRKLGHKIAYTRAVRRYNRLYGRDE